MTSPAQTWNKQRNEHRLVSHSSVCRTLPWSWPSFSVWTRSCLLSVSPCRLPPRRSRPLRPRCCHRRRSRPPPSPTSSAAGWPASRQRRVWLEKLKGGCLLWKAFLWSFSAHWPDSRWTSLRGCSQSPTGPRWILSSCWTCQICLCTPCREEDPLDPRMHWKRRRRRSGQVYFSYHN